MNNNILEHDGVFQLIMSLNDQAYYVDLSKIHYTLGNFTITNSYLKTKQKFQSFWHGQQAFKPLIQGSGELVFKSSVFNIFQISLNEQRYFIDIKKLLAASASLSFQPYITHSPIARLSGTPKLQYMVEGTGMVYMVSPGPVKKLQINKESLKLNTMLLARECSTKLNKVSWSQLENNSFDQGNKRITQILGPGNVYIPEYIRKEAAEYVKQK